jgi:hypothetical protein
MNRKLLKHLEKQFGGNWSCSCRTPFDPTRFEILTENQDSFLAHYICPVCGREQMLAAALSTEDVVKNPPSVSLKSEALSTNDVLDIRAEVRKAPIKKIKSWLKANRKETASAAATDVDTLLRFSKE